MVYPDRYLTIGSREKLMGNRGATVHHRGFLRELFLYRRLPGVPPRNFLDHDGSPWELSGSPRAPVGVLSRAAGSYGLPPFPPEPRGFPRETAEQRGNCVFFCFSENVCELVLPLKVMLHIVTTSNKGNDMFSVVFLVWSALGVINVENQATYTLLDGNNNITNISAGFSLGSYRFHDTLLGFQRKTVGIL